MNRSSSKDTLANSEEQQNQLKLLVSYKMPYGKYKGRLICELPEYYLVWLYGRGFRKDKLGQLLASMYEIKLNGLEYLLKPLKKRSN